MYVFNRRAIKRRQGLYFGCVRVKPCSYLETTVELGGVRQKIGLIDGRCNLKLGDSAEFQAGVRGSGLYWNLPYSDAVLRDVNGSGKFESDILGSEVEPLSSLIWFGANP